MGARLEVDRVSAAKFDATIAALLGRMGKDVNTFTYEQLVNIIWRAIGVTPPKTRAARKKEVTSTRDLVVSHKNHTRTARRATKDDYGEKIKGWGYARAGWFGALRDLGALRKPDKNLKQQGLAHGVGQFRPGFMAAEGLAMNKNPYIGELDRGSPLNRAYHIRVRARGKAQRQARRKLKYLARKQAEILRAR